MLNITQSTQPPVEFVSLCEMTECLQNFFLAFLMVAPSRLAASWLAGLYCTDILEYLTDVDEDLAAAAGYRTRGFLGVY